MADDLGIMLTELPEAESISDNDLLYLVKENNSEKVKAKTIKDSLLGGFYGEASGNPASFADGAAAGLVKCIAEIVPKQAGSGTPSPSNVRAISGYTAVKVYTAGKNLLDNTLCIERTINGIQRKVNNDGTITITGTSTVTGQWWNSVDNLGVFFKKGTYTISCNEVELYALFRKAQIVSGTFTLSEDDYLDNAFFITTVGETYNLRTEPMIRLATESDTFEPYKGSTTTTQLGQTVYGGTLDVTRGELTITHRVITENDFVSVSSGTSGGGLHYANCDLSEPEATSANAISNMLVQNQSGWASTTPCFATNTGSAPNIYPVRIYCSESTLADFKAAYSGLQICYELATPITVQLTPQEVNSLLGQNNISADTGDVDIVYVKASAPIKPNPSGEADGYLSSIELNGVKFEIIKELPTFPTSDGDYKLKLSVSSGVPTLSWVSDT